MLKRLDIYASESPKLQQATTSLVTSRKIRNTAGWEPVKSIFFLEESCDLTFDLVIDSTGKWSRCPISNRVSFYTVIIELIINVILL